MEPMRVPGFGRCGFCQGGWVECIDPRDSSGRETCCVRCSNCSGTGISTNAVEPLPNGIFPF